jgi:hypothetical protein
MVPYHRYYTTSDNQYLFDTYLRGLLLFGKLLFKTLVYLPHLFTAYLLSTLLLTNADSGLSWCALMLLSAFVLHLLLQGLQILTYRLKARHHLLWPFLLLGILAFTCGLPVYAVWDMSGDLFQGAKKSLQPILTAAFALHLFRRHQFYRLLWK